MDKCTRCDNQTPETFLFGDFQVCWECKRVLDQQYSETVTEDILKSFEPIDTRFLPEKY